MDDRQEKKRGGGGNEKKFSSILYDNIAKRCAKCRHNGKKIRGAWECQPGKKWRLLLVLQVWLLSHHHGILFLQKALPVSCFLFLELR